MYISDSEYEDTCDMLLIRKLLDDKYILSHYVLISDLSKLLCKQSKANSRLLYCRRCLQHFRCQERLDDYVKSCKIGAQKQYFQIVKINSLDLKTLKIKFQHHLWYILILRQLMIKT